MSKTVVGLFESTAKAEQVKKTLVADGYEAQNIRVVANDANNMSGDANRMTNDSARMTGDASATASDKGYTDIGSGGGTGIGEKVSSFFRNLTGGDEDVHNHYASGVNQGGALLTATVDDNDASAVAATLKEYGAREIEGGNQQRPVASATSANFDKSQTGANMTGETAIPIVEEELVVGKREVDRGGVRIYSHVVERPVEADVTLRDERVNVERRAVNRPATAADFTTGESSFELRATGEEAVVGKNSRVVEEVLVGKQSNERTEAIHDTVRKTEVEVEQITGDLTEKKNRY